MISAGSAVCFSAMTASHVTFRVICKSQQPTLGSITEMRGMTQLGLFAEPQAGPAGLRYADDFVEAAAEQALIGRIAALPLQRFQFGAFEGNRRVASFGYRYDYTLQRLPGPSRSRTGSSRSRGRSRHGRASPAAACGRCSAPNMRAGWAVARVAARS